jgi:hypothetical protein
MAVTFLTGAQAQDVNPVPSIHSAGEVHAAEGKYDLSAALVLDNIIKLHRIPPGAIPIDCRLEMDDLDSGTAMIGSLALMEEGGADIIANSELIKDSTLGQAGGVARMDQLDTARRAVLEKAVEKPRFVVFKVTTAPGTGLTSGRIKSSVLYRGAEYGEK